MNKYTHNYLYAFIICVLQCYSITAMNESTNYPQIQLQDAIEEPVTINLYGMMIENPSLPECSNPITYATKSIHNHFQFSTTIYDPLVKFKIIDDSSKVLFQKIIPLKYCFNLNDDSELITIEKQGSQICPNDPLLKDKHIHVKILCKKNPKLPGNSFAQQRYAITNQFFKDAFFYVDKQDAIWIDEKDNIKELTDANIIEKTASSIINYELTNGSTINHEVTLFNHGPNGCSSQQHIRQALIDEKIPNKQTVFKALMNRQINGKF